MEEIWKDIPDYEGLYKISNFGNIKSLNYHRTGKEGVLKLEKDKYGYLKVGLHKNGKANVFQIHRLVALAFLPNPEEKPQVDHINTDRTDNRVENLRWVTVKENHENPLTKRHHKESVSTIDYKNKMSKISKGINQSLVIRKKKSDMAKKNWGNPEYRKKAIDGLIKSSAKTVLQIDKITNEIVKEWVSMAEAARAFNIKYNNISQCCSGKKKSAGGYKWMYKDYYDIREKIRLGVA